ncbi:MAG: transglycosylase SLT domain-containing protein [Opitutae bacterium]
MKWVAGRSVFSSWTLGILCLLGGCKYFDPGANFIDEKKVWAKIKKEAPELGLEPSFVYAICHAESSLNANAETSIAKGMMQLTEPAWSDVTKLHYRTAFQWETNIEVGMLYLKRLKGMLESVDMFNYPRLAASYRYGYGALRQEQYMVSRMKTPINRIYRKLFAGQLSPVPTPEE